jgi:imidazolonepropionase-like amidohydrolase
VALAFAAPGGVSAQVTAIRAGRLIDPDAGTAATNQAILVEKGHITAVGADVRIAAGATVIDLSRATVLPGLFDAHAHLCMTVLPKRDAGNYYYTTLNDPDSFRAIQGAANAKAMLEAGFTTVRDVGNEGNYACVSLRRAIDLGFVPGPTMITAGRIIAPYGGQFFLQPEKRDLATPEYFFADSRDEMRRGVRENAHYGALVIKIVVDDQRYIYSADDIRFLKDEAAVAGLKLAAHAWTAQGAHNAAEAGVASIEHGPRLSDEDLQLAKRNNVVLVGTDYLSIGDSANHGVWIDRLKRAYRIGVIMAYGTDATEYVPGQSRGALAIRGIEPWIEAGIPPRALIQALTTNAARLLGVDKERGALRQGLAADIIATADNPLDGAAALKHVVFVMKEGAVVKQER